VALGVVVIPAAFWGWTGSAGAIEGVARLAHLDQRIPTAAEVDAVHLREAQAVEMTRLPDGDPVSFAAKERFGRRRSFGYAYAAQEVLQETPAAVGVAAVVLGIVGLAWGRRAIVNKSAVTSAVALAAIVTAGCFHLAATAGYLSARHLVLLAVPA